MKVQEITRASEARKSAPARTEVVEELLHEAGTSLWLAAPKVGKSTITRQLAVNVATGQPFLGRKTTQGSVLLCGLEDDERSMVKHLDQMRGSKGQESLYIATQLDGRGSPLGELEKALEQIGGVRLCILDTLQRFARLEDLNDYGRVGPFMADVADLAKRTKTHIAIVHHSRKRQGSSSTESALGSTAIVAGVDVPICMTLEPNDLRAIASDGGRYTQPFKKVFMRFDLSTGTTSLADTVEDARDKAARAKRDGSEETMRGFIGTNPGADRQAILESTIGDRNRLNDALTQMVEGGSVIRMGSGKRGDGFKFFLSDNMSEEAPVWKQ